MTQPDGTFPTGAANYSSLATFAAKTQEDWESGLHDAETTRWSQPLEGLFGDMPTGQNFLLTLLSELSKRLLGLDPTTWFASLEDAWNSLTDWAETLWENGEQAFNDWLTSTFAALQTGYNQIVDIFNNLVVTPINSEIQAIKDWWDNLTAERDANLTKLADQGNWWARLTLDVTIFCDLMHRYYPAGSESDGPTTTSTAYGPARRTWYSAIADFNSLFNNVTTGPPLAVQAADVGTFAQSTQTLVLTNQDTLVQVQADVDALKTDNSSVAGAKFLSSANGTSSTWGPLWTVTPTNANISPKTTLDLFDMNLAASSSIDLKLAGVFTGGVTLTDDQIVSVVFQDAAKDMAGGFGPRNVVKGRMDAAGANYIYARVNFTKVELGYAVGGVEQTPWATATGVSVPAGALLELHCGSSAGHRNYQVVVGGRVVITYAEVGTSSQLGASYRGGGQDQAASHGVFNDTFPPARVKQFKLQDSNAASTTYGTSARFYRAATTWSAITKGAAQTLGSAAYDTTEYCSSDIALVANGFAIYTPGRYQVKHAAKLSSSNLGWVAVPSGGTSYAGINRISFPGPTVVSYASSRYDQNSAIGVGGSFSFNAVGDGGVTELWAPSAAISGSGTYYLGGDGAGEGTWVTIERID